MTTPRISQVLLWLLVAVTVLLFGFFVALVAGAIPVDDPAPPPDTGLLDKPAAGAEQTESTAVTKQASGVAPAVATTKVIVRAARGESWMSARVGSENGRLLDERLLDQGESVEVRGARVWLSIGVAANVDVTVNGKEHKLESGTVSVVLGPT